MAKKIKGKPINLGRTIAKPSSELKPKPPEKPNADKKDK